MQNHFGGARPLLPGGRWGGSSSEYYDLGGGHTPDSDVVIPSYVETVGRHTLEGREPHDVPVVRRNTFSAAGFRSSSVGHVQEGGIEHAGFRGLLGVASSDGGSSPVAEPLLPGISDDSSDFECEDPRSRGWLGSSPWAAKSSLLKKSCMSSLVVVGCIAAITAAVWGGSSVINGSSSPAAFAFGNPKGAYRDTRSSKNFNRAVVTHNFSDEIAPPGHETDVGEICYALGVGRNFGLMDSVTSYISGGGRPDWHEEADEPDEVVDESLFDGFVDEDEEDDDDDEEDDAEGDEKGPLDLKSSDLKLEVEGEGPAPIELASRRRRRRLREREDRHRRHWRHRRHRRRRHGHRHRRERRLRRMQEASLLDMFGLGNASLGAASSIGFFSQLTVKNSSGAESVLNDDRLCVPPEARPYDPRKCLGAPYLYVSFHGGYSDKRVKNVCKYTRDGCAVSSVLLPNSLYKPHSLRGLLHMHGSLYVAEAWKKESKILRYSRCNANLGHRRELLDIVVETNDTNPGMVHPYAFAKHAQDPFLYVSSQDTYQVLRFHQLTGQPGPLSLALQGGHSHKDTTRDKLNPGTFVDLGKDDIRGLAFDQHGLLYVANKRRGVLVYDANGFRIGEFPIRIKGAISVFYCKERNSIWVGSKKRHRIYEFDATTWELLQTIRHHHLKHPAGMVSYGDSLFVLSQDRNKLLEFSIMSGRLKRVVLDRLPDDGERIILSPC